MLRDMYYQEDNHLEEANCRVADSYDEEVHNNKLTRLEKVIVIKWSDINQHCLLSIY